MTFDGRRNIKVKVWAKFITFVLISKCMCAQFVSCTATSNEHVSIATTTNTSINNKLLPIQEK
jgi:ABC-type tungstate transport system permease subunit